MRDWRTDLPTRTLNAQYPAHYSYARKRLPRTYTGARVNLSVSFQEWYRNETEWNYPTYPPNSPDLH